jgi:proline iminopeptidase
MKHTVLIAAFSVLLLFACTTSHREEDDAQTADYFSLSADSVQTGGEKTLIINTPNGPHKIWTKRIGHNPKIKLLLLAGGPGCSHEYWECMESFLPKEGIEFIYYDQLGCGFSDNPNDTSMWDLDRYVDELEQVRKGLNLDSSNFFLLGHSWGGILAMQYALKYQSHMKGLIISNMMSSCPKYDQYAADVLSKQMPKEILDSIQTLESAGQTSNPRYMALLNKHFYEKHICRMAEANWPEPVRRSFARLNSSLYVTMQGPSEFGISGKLENWDVSQLLKNISTHTLVIGATHDTMDPEHMRWMSTQFPKGEFLLCKNGSHMCMYDDQKTYMNGLIGFLHKNQ